MHMEAVASSSLSLVISNNSLLAACFALSIDDLISFFLIYRHDW
jgi:hypothetical protein